VNVENIDVFYEKGIFESEDAKSILEEGKKIGLNINFHGDELNPMKSGIFGAQIGCFSLFLFIPFIFFLFHFLNRCKGNFTFGKG
jgi:hypothetical protein